MPKQHNGADDGHDEARGLSFLIPADGATGPGREKEPATPISMVTMIPPGSLPGMIEFRYGPDDESDEQCPEQMHTVFLRAGMAGVYRPPQRGGKYSLKRVALRVRLGRASRASLDRTAEGRRPHVVRELRQTPDLGSRQVPPGLKSEV